MTIILLCCISFLAGFVDCIVGGGGLIQIPALFLIFPTLPPATIFGTNKLAMFAGTSVALIRYARRVTIPWKVMLPTALIAAAGAFMGARTVKYFDPALLKPIILVLLVSVAAYTYSRKELGAQRVKINRSPAKQMITAGILGLSLGFYDGFFGPGTGSFLIFGFVSLLGFEFLLASGCAKLVNMFTNLTPILYFASQGNVLYEYSLPMGACNILGALAGTKLAFARGNQFVRRFFLVLVALLIARFGWDLFTQ